MCPERSFGSAAETIAEPRESSGERVLVACPACGSKTHVPELRGTDPLSRDAFEVVRCRSCALVYVNPRPTDRKLPDYYPDDTYFADRHPFFKDELMGLRVRALGPVLAGGKLLDVGCGRGDFILAAKRRGWQAMGAEVPKSPIMTLGQGMGIEVIPVERMGELPARSFDAVTVWHVLEHMTDPKGALTEIRRLLKDDGRLLIEVPNFGSWQARMSREHWYHFDVPRHLIHFERVALEEMLSDAGFTPQRWTTFSLEYDTFGLAQSILNRVCATPNHLYQVIIGEPTGGGRRDTLLSFALLPFVGAFAGVVSLVAPLLGKGGVLRVLARKRL